MRPRSAWGVVGALLVALALVHGGNAACSDHSNDCSACLTSKCSYKPRTGTCRDSGSESGGFLSKKDSKRLGRQCGDNNDPLLRAVEVSQLRVANKLVRTLDYFWGEHDATPQLVEAVRRSSSGDRDGWVNLLKAYIEKRLWRRFQGWVIATFTRSTDRDSVLEYVVAKAKKLQLGLQHALTYLEEQDEVKARLSRTPVDDSKRSCTADHECENRDDGSVFEVCCVSDLGDPSAKGECVFAGRCPVSVSSSIMFSRAGKPIHEVASELAALAPQSPHDDRSVWGHCRGYQVLNQVSCGTCWAHAMTSTLSVRLCRETGGYANIKLSPQDMAEKVYFDRNPSYQDYLAYREYKSKLLRKSRFGRMFLKSQKPMTFQHWFRWKDLGHRTGEVASWISTDARAVLPEVCKPYQCLKLSARTRKLIKKVLRNAGEWSESVSSELSSFSNSDAQERYAKDKAVASSIATSARETRSDIALLKTKLKTDTKISGLLAYDQDRMSGLCENSMIPVRTKASRPQWVLPRNHQNGDESGLQFPLSTFVQDVYNDWGATITQIEDELRENGPMAMALWGKFGDKEYFKKRNGIYVPVKAPTSTSHAVMLVGWGEDSKGVQYWIIQNSWGEKWNEKGYARFQKGFPCKDGRGPSDFGGVCGMDLFFSMWLIERKNGAQKEVMGPVLSSDVLKKYRSLEKQCNVQCANGGVPLKNCECECEGAWEPPSCARCGLSCDTNHVLNERKCQCECPEGSLGEDCDSKTTVVVDCSRVSKRKIKMRLDMRMKGYKNQNLTWIFKKTATNGKVLFTKKVKMLAKSRTKADITLTVPRTALSAEGEWSAYVTENLGINELGHSLGTFSHLLITTSGDSCDSKNGAFHDEDEGGSSSGFYEDSEDSSSLDDSFSEESSSIPASSDSSSLASSSSSPESGESGSAGFFDSEFESSEFMRRDPEEIDDYGDDEGDDEFGSLGYEPASHRPGTRRRRRRNLRPIRARIFTAEEDSSADLDANALSADSIPDVLGDPYEMEGLMPEMDDYMDRLDLQEMNRMLSQVEVLVNEAYRVRNRDVGPSLLDPIKNRDGRSSAASDVNGLENSSSSQSGAYGISSPEESSYSGDYGFSSRDESSYEDSSSY